MITQITAFPKLYIGIDIHKRSWKVHCATDLFSGKWTYNKKVDSPWGFEISTTNLFNTKFRRQSSFSDFLISDQSAFIIPRIILFKVSYKP